MQYSLSVFSGLPKPRGMRPTQDMEEGKTAPVFPSSFTPYLQGRPVAKLLDGLVEPLSGRIRTHEGEDQQDDRSGEWDQRQQDQQSALVAVVQAAHR